MKRRKALLFMTLAELVLAAPAAAQFIPGTSPMDMSMQSRALTNSVINRNTMRATVRRSTAPRFNPARRPVVGASAEAMSDAPFPFRTSAALRQQVLNEFLTRASRSDPEAAKAVAAEFGRSPYQQSFADAVRPTGLSPDDAADVMAVYLVSGWEIANGKDASLTAVRAVRRQVAGEMARNAALRDPTTRAKLAEELKIITVLFGSSVENAKREGNAARFSAGVAAHYRQTMNRDLRAMQLNSDGFSGG